MMTGFPINPNVSESDAWLVVQRVFGSTANRQKEISLRFSICFAAMYCDLRYVRTENKACYRALKALIESDHHLGSRFPGQAAVAAGPSETE